MIRMLLLVIASIAIAGCELRSVDTSCTAFSPITYSAKMDSPETVTQVRMHNAAWVALCK